MLYAMENNTNLKIYTCDGIIIIVWWISTETEQINIKCKHIILIVS